MNFLLHAINQWLSALPPSARLALSVLLLGVVASIDYLVGYELSFSIFYLLPVALGAWYLGRRAALLIALAAAITWLAVDWTSGRQYSHPLIGYWNAGVRLGFFLIVAELLQRLQASLQEQRELARHDPLTGLLNARTFKRRCAEHLALARRHPRGVCIGYLDLDGFKQINDTLGHSVGDAVLKQVAKTMLERMRVTDICARLGGDEFGLLLPETDEAGAQHIFSLLFADLHAMATAHGWTLGYSIGVIVFTSFPGTEQQAIAQADALMYRVKRSGKDRVQIEASVDPPAADDASPD